MKKFISLLLTTIIVFSLSGCSSSMDNFTSIESDVSRQESKKDVHTDDLIENSVDSEKIDVVNYDKLQSLFMTLDFETTENSLIDSIEDNNLEYTSKKYNGTPKTIHYKIAYEHDVALQKYAKSGDYIEISFSQENNTFMFAEYFNSQTFKTAIIYNYGTYWKLMEKEENNRYSGYYYHTPGENEGGITIEYNNGNSTETGYNRVDTVEDAVYMALVY